MANQRKSKNTMYNKLMQDMAPDAGFQILSEVASAPKNPSATGNSKVTEIFPIEAFDMYADYWARQKYRSGTQEDPPTWEVDALSTPDYQHHILDPNWLGENIFNFRIGGGGSLLDQLTPWGGALDESFNDIYRTFRDNAFKGVPTFGEVGEQLGAGVKGLGEGLKAGIGGIGQGVIGAITSAGNEFYEMGKDAWDWVTSWSDATMKENIEFVGKSPLGINIYEFEFKDKQFGKGKHRGVLAQELLNTEFKDSVARHPNGYLVVNYGNLDVDLEKVSKKEK